MERRANLPMPDYGYVKDLVNTAGQTSQRHLSSRPLKVVVDAKPAMGGSLASDQERVTL